MITQSTGHGLDSIGYYAIIGGTRVAITADQSAAHDAALRAARPTLTGAQKLARRSKLGR